MLPVLRGHILDGEDLVLRRHILNIMCRFETAWRQPKDQHPTLYEGLERMKEVVDDGLVVMEDEALRVTPAGKPFLRNICMALDARLWRNEPETRIFSQAI